MMCACRPLDVISRRQAGERYSSLKAAFAALQEQGDDVCGVCGEPGELLLCDGKGEVVTF